jgi:hypothetical protein
MVRSRHQVSSHPFEPGVHRPSSPTSYPETRVRSSTRHHFGIPASTAVRPRSKSAPCWPARLDSGVGWVPNCCQTDEDAILAMVWSAGRRCRASVPGITAGQGAAPVGVWRVEGPNCCQAGYSATVATVLAVSLDQEMPLRGIWARRAGPADQPNATAPTKPISTAHCRRFMRLRPANPALRAGFA